MEIKEVDALVSHLADLETRHKQLTQEAAAIHQDAELLRTKLMGMLQENNIESFEGRAGKVWLSNRFTVRFPQDLAERNALREYLIKTGAFDTKWTMNYQALNSWYKQEIEEFQRKGEMPDIPGLNPTHEKIISFKKRS